MACGGAYLADASKCWTYDGSSWTALPDSTNPHCFFSAPNVISDQGWWVAGPHQDDDNSCSLSEWTSDIFTGEEWIPGPQHPTGFSWGSCLVNVNSTHTLHTGGHPTLTESWLYDWSLGAWTQTGNLNEGREEHGCAVLEGQGVLVAGGHEGENDVYSVELYDPESGTWTLQPSLPQDIKPDNPLLVTWEESVLAMFKGEVHVYQRGEDGTWSTLQGVFLPVSFAGRDDKAILVPRELPNGCF